MSESFYVRESVSGRRYGPSISPPYSLSLSLSNTLSSPLDWQSVWWGRLQLCHPEACWCVRFLTRPTSTDPNGDRLISGHLLPGFKNSKWQGAFGGWRKAAYITTLISNTADAEEKETSTRLSAVFFRWALLRRGGTVTAVWGSPPSGRGTWRGPLGSCLHGGKPGEGVRERVRQRPGGGGICTSLHLSGLLSSARRDLNVTLTPPVCLHMQHYLN